MQPPIGHYLVQLAIRPHREAPRIDVRRPVLCVGMRIDRHLIALCGQVVHRPLRLNLHHLIVLVEVLEYLDPPIEFDEGQRRVEKFVLVRKGREEVDVDTALVVRAAGDVDLEEQAR